MRFGTNKEGKKRDGKSFFFFKERNINISIFIDFQTLHLKYFDGGLNLDCLWGKIVQKEILLKLFKMSI